MGTLNQEVSQLTKDLHHMMHLLQTQMAVQHYSASIPSYPYGMHMVPNAVGSGANLAYSVCPSMHLHPEHHASDLHLHYEHPAAGAVTAAVTSDLHAVHHHEGLRHLGANAWNAQGVCVCVCVCVCV